MTDTPSNRRSRAANILIITVIVLLAPPLVYLVLTALVGQPPQLFRRALPQVPPPNTAEAVTLAFDTPTTTTEGVYSGTVKLVAVGFGQLESSAYSDALYTYTAPDGLSLDEAVPVGLVVNGERVVPPPYNPFHIYEFRVDAGPEPTPLMFALPANNPADNTGEVIFYVVPEGLE